MKKHSNFMKTSYLSILVGLGLTTPLVTEAAVDMQPAKSTIVVVPAAGTHFYNITGYDGSTYTIPYAYSFNSEGPAVGRYNWYNGKKINVLYRSHYGDTVTYMPFPDAQYRTKDSYSFDDLYEVKKEQAPYAFSQAFWRLNSVKKNTVDCGQREYGDTTYLFGCVLDSSNGFPNSGHINYSFGIRKNGTFGGTGEWGEARFIGYSSFGGVIDNTYFPMDNRQKATSATYPYVSDIFAVKVNTPTKTDWDSAPKGTTKYNQKKDAIQELMNQGILPKDKGDAEAWMSRLSLLTNPITEAPVFKGMRDNGEGYHILVLDPYASASMNVGITSMKIKNENGEVLGGMTRHIGTDYIVIEYSGMELNQRPKLEAGDQYTVEVVLKNGSEATTKAKSQEIILDGVTYENCGSLGAGQECVFKIPYTAPDKEMQELVINAKVSDKYFGTGDNLNHDDDYASIKIGVNKPPRGDLGVSGIYLVRASDNKIVDYAIQGVDYYFIFENKYIGDSMKGAEIDLRLDYTLDTYERNSSTEEYQSNKVSYSTASVPVKLTGGTAKEPQQIFFTSKVFKATSSKISIEATIKGGEFKWNYNDDKEGLNDTASRHYNSPIDLALKNVTIDPGNHPGGDYCGAFNINFGVDFRWNDEYRDPSIKEVQTVRVGFWIERDGTDVKIGETFIRVRVGQTSAQRYTHMIESVCIPENSKIKVELNPLHELEEQSRSNNTASIHWNTKYDAGYCENKKHNTTNWKQQYIISSEKLEGFNDKVGIWDSEKDAETNNLEQLAITKIEMRSKLMTDKGMGHAGDGWVDALHLGANDKIEIKAGYGFDIRVTVEYETNAYVNELNNTRLQSAPRDDVYSWLKEVELFDNLYIKLPDSGAGRKLVSLNSEGVKLKREEQRVERVGSKDRHTIVYTIESRTSSNTGKETSSLFVNENTKDGEYELTFYTSPILGVPGKTPQTEGTPPVIISNGHPTTYAPLCDSHTFKFFVKGSVYDDLNINIIK